MDLYPRGMYDLHTDRRIISFWTCRSTDKNEVGFLFLLRSIQNFYHPKPNENLSSLLHEKIYFKTSSHPTPPTSHAPPTSSGPGVPRHRVVFLRIARAGRLMGILGPSGAGLGGKSPRVFPHTHEGFKERSTKKWGPKFQASKKNRCFETGTFVGFMRGVHGE